MSQHVDRVGQQVGNYRLEQLLGTGGFAEVYLGRQVFLESLAAIKLLHANLAQAESEGFRAEAVTLVRLIHPHIGGRGRLRFAGYDWEARSIWRSYRGIDWHRYFKQPYD